MPYLKYLEFIDFNSYYQNIQDIIKNKKILLYGESYLFKYMYKESFINKLNIIGISDKKYEDDITGEVNNLKKIPICKIADYSPECILVTIVEYKTAVEELKKAFPNILVLPLAKRSETQEKLLREYKNDLNSIYLVNSEGRIRVNKVEGFDIQFNGSFNYVEIHCEKENLSKFKNCKIKFGDNNSFVSIKSTSQIITNLNISMRENGNLILNENIMSWGFTVFCRNANCIIGSDCYIGWGTDMRCDDGHKLYDETGKLINPPEDIVIGNNVWIGKDCQILKGTVVHNGCVIGAKSLLNKKYKESNALLAGSPAKVLKQNISWKP